MFKWKKYLLSVLVITALLMGSTYAPSYAKNKETISVEQWISGYLIQYQLQLITFDTPTKKQQSTPKKWVTKKTPKEKANPSKEKANHGSPATQLNKPAAKPANNKSNNNNNQVQSNALLPIEQEVVRLVNDERTKRGLKPLKMDPALSLVARDKSKDMRDRNYFSHTSPTYGSPFDMMKAYGITYRAAGENIAAGQTTAEEVVKSWMNSEGHRKNILSPEFTTIGVGYAKGGTYGHYWTQMFISR